MELVVARSVVEHGRIELAPAAPERLEAPAGTSLLVRHLFTAREGSWRRDAYRFSLCARLGWGPIPAVTVQVGDNWGSHDAEAGHAEQRIRVPLGRTTLAFEASAEYAATGWRDRRLLAFQSRHLCGELVLVGR